MALKALQHARATPIADKTTAEPQLIGDSAVMQDVPGYWAVVEIQCQCIITGETGTGKELWPERCISSPRAQPFVALNMAAIPNELIESELFGHEKGALPERISVAPGVLTANHGTLFWMNRICR